LQIVRAPVRLREQTSREVLFRWLLVFQNMTQLPSNFLNHEASLAPSFKLKKSMENLNKWIPLSVLITPRWASDVVSITSQQWKEKRVLGS
jgi:hypothetical protein